MGSFRRRPFAWSKGRCGPECLAGRPVASGGFGRVQTVLRRAARARPSAFGVRLARA